MRILPLRRAVVTAALAASCLPLLATGASYADEATDAPVTADDRISVRGNVFRGAGIFTDVNPELHRVLANDSDPNGDDLAICRVEVPENAPIFVSPTEDFLDESSSEGSEGAGRGWSYRDDSRAPTALYAFATDNRAATYPVTYWACDHDYLTPATVYVTVKPITPVTARKVPGRPDRVRFANPGPRAAVVVYGAPRGGDADGRVRLAPGRSKVVTVERRRISYYAYERRSHLPLGNGFVRGLRPR